MIRAAGNHIQIASDILPLLVGVNTVLTGVWFVIVGPLLCASTPGSCVSSPGARHYDSIWIGTLLLSATAFSIDAALIVLGLRGGPVSCT